MEATDEEGAKIVGGRRDELLDIAIDLFAQRGFAGTSIRDIAGAAGCSAANVYHHFRNKEALMLAILEQSMRNLPGRLRAAMAAASPPLDRFEQLVRAHIANSTRYLRETRIFLIEEEHLSPEGHAVNRALQRELLSIYVGELRLLANAGIADAAELRVTALNVLGVINWHLRWMKPAAAAALRTAETNAMVGFILRGVASARPGAA